MKRSEQWLNAVRSIPDCVLCGRHGTEAAHRDWGKGMGLKCPDYLTAALCSECHFELGNGKKMTKAERRAYMDRALVLTVDALARQGKIGVVDGQGIVQVCSASVRRVRKAVRVNPDGRAGHGTVGREVRRTTGSGSRLRSRVPARDQVSDAGGGTGAVEGETRLLAQGEEIRFSLPLTLPTLNTLLRMHWSKRRKLEKWVSEEVFVATRQKYGPILLPIARCRIVVTRYSNQEPDPDGMRSTAKLLLDVLQPYSVIHPRGMGIILEDSKACIAELRVEHAHGASRTDVLITGE